MSTEYQLTKKKIREAFEVVPADTRLTLFISMCYTVTLLNNKEKTGNEIYEMTWTLFEFYMNTFGIVDIIGPMLEAIAKDGPDGVIQ